MEIRCLGVSLLLHRKLHKVHYLKQLALAVASLVLQDEIHIRRMLYLRIKAVGDAFEVNSGLYHLQTTKFTFSRRKGSSLEWSWRLSTKLKTLEH